MGYETEVFLVDGTNIFGKWEPKSSYWYTKNLTPGENKDIDALPQDAKFSDGGYVVASIGLSKIGSDGPETTLPGLFARNRKRQKDENKYVFLKWRMVGDGDEEPLVTDCHGDPYVVHDARETLAALRESIRREKEEYEGLPDSSRNMWTNRRLAMFEPMLVNLIERFSNCAVITKGC